MITPSQLRNTARYGTHLSKETIEQLADRLEQAEIDKGLLDYAEKNPERVVTELKVWWQLSEGCRENFFNFRAIIRNARDKVSNDTTADIK